MGFMFEHREGTGDVVEGYAGGPQRGHLLSERPGCGRALGESLTGEGIHRRARAQPALPSELLYGDCDVIVKGDRRPHAATVAR